MFLSCKIKAIPIIEKKNKQKTTKKQKRNTEFGGGLDRLQGGVVETKKG